MLVLVKSQDIITKERVPPGWTHPDSEAEVRANPWLRLVIQALAAEGSRREFPTEAEARAFAQENPLVDFQTILADGGECPEGLAWFFARREGRQDFDESWAVSERLGELPWLLKSRDAA